MDISDKWCPSGSIVEQVPFNIFINDIDIRIVCTLSEYADDSKLSGEVDTPGGRDAIQWDPDKLKKWACVNFITFSKYSVLHLRQGNPQYQYRLEN